MKTFVFSVLFLAIALTFSTEAKSSSCASVFSDSSLPVVDVVETVFGSQVSYSRIGFRRLGRLRASDLNAENAIFVGINEVGHMYLVAGNYRYDGEFYFKSPQLKNNSQMLDSGIVIRIEDPSGELKNQVIANFQRNRAPRSVNCARGICNVFSQAAGIRVDQRALRTSYPTTFLKRFIEREITTTDGQPITSSIFVLGDHSLGNLVTNIRSRERRETLAGSYIGASFAVFLYSMGMSASSFF